MLVVIPFGPPVAVVLISAKAVVGAMCDAGVAATEFSDGCFLG